ncbi:hypothetical protein LOK49_LG13G02278 [Camellia lanceoleosa]|uniref:Uncharacterized protein n=1 Tax=Camellia lanceoleosa TaxID=1840588 RepID=A0ACC0FML9_9ERIC|nr:hypothetical protein LOK49_LG13G02278 [Camellia lanceoleosa]
MESVFRRLETTSSTLLVPVCPGTGQYAALVSPSSSSPDDISSISSGTSFGTLCLVMKSFSMLMFSSFIETNCSERIPLLALTEYVSDPRRITALTRGNYLSAAAIIGHDGSVWAQSSSFLQFKPEEIAAIMTDFAAPGSLAPTGLYLGGTKYMVIQGEQGAVTRGKKLLFCEAEAFSPS